MANRALLQLAQDLEWLGCELEYYGHRHAMEGYPESGSSWEAFLDKQKGVLSTGDKLERELKNSVRFNPTKLVGMDFPLEAALAAVTDLLRALEDIKQCAVGKVHELPGKVRKFSKMVDLYVNEGTALAR